MKNLPVPPPLSFACPKKWESMRVDGSQQRFCEQCQLHVHDLSAMSSSEATGVLAGMNGRVCVSYQVAPDSSMVMRTRWSGLQKTWTVVRRGVFALLAMAAPFWFTACANDKADCYRTGGTPAITGDGKDSSPASARPLHDTRLTGRTSRP